MSAPWPFTQEEWDKRKAEQEMDAARGSLTELAALYDSATAETARVRQERDQVVSAFNVAEELRLKAVAELKRVREHQEIRARVIREKNAKLREVEHLLGIDAIYPPRDVADAVRELLAGLEQLRAVRSWLVARDGGRDCERCEQEVERGQAYEIQPGTGGLLAHIHCPTSKEKTMPATNDGPIADPMINDSASALWPHLPGDVQDGHGLDDVRPWAAATAAAALRVMADEIDRGPTFSLPPSVISALVRERANRLTDVPDRGAR